MGGFSDSYSDLYDPAFPQTQLDLRTELQLAGVWTDISKKVYYRDGVTITRGHPDESSTATPSTGSLTVNNRGGQFSPRNPLGVYFGQIGRNTPLRMSLPDNSTYLRMEDDTTSYVSCPDNARLDITGDIDIRLDVALSGYGQMTLATKWNTTTDHSWAFRLNPDGTLVFEYLDGSAGGHVATGTAPIPLGRISLRVTWQGNNGSGGHTTVFYTAASMAGPWTQLGTAATGSGVLTLATTTAPLQVGFSPGYVTASGNTASLGPTGKFYSFALLSGIGGTTVANPVWSGRTAGTTPFADAQGNLWSYTGTAMINDRKYRHHGEVPAWPPRWDTTGNDVYAPIQASGLLRRLGQGTNSGAPLNSAMYRAYVRLAGTLAPIAYWPCEDGTSATQFASAIGGTPMSIFGAPQLASDTSFLCSDNLPVVNNSAWNGSVPGATTTANSFRFLLKVPSSSPPADQTVIARLYTAGTVALAELRYATGGNLRMLGYNQAGTQIFDTGNIIFGILDQTLRASVTLQPSGGNVQYTMGTLAPGAGAAFVSGGTVAGSIGAATRVTIAPNADIAQAVIGHVSVQAAYDDLFDLAGALNAWQGEAAGNRFARLCTEEGVPSRVYGLPADCVAMGPQRLLKLVDLLQECESADKGLIFEPRQALALGYRTRVSMFNQAAALTLSYASAQLSDPMEPTDDDQYTTNDVTAQRTNGGSSARQVLSSGTMSIQAPPNGIGRYPSTDSVNVDLDTQLNDDAGWMVHLGTVDDVRYPTLSVDLARSELTAVYYTAQDADIGDRLAVTNTPSWLPPDGISQIMRGVTETCYGFTHTETWVCVPEAPYRVGVYDDAVLGHYDTDGSTVQTGISSTAGTMLVATTNPASPLWTTSAGDFPFDIEVGGERMTVTNITGSSSPQTFTVTRSVNGVVKAQAAGTDVRLFQPAVYSM